LPNSRVINDAFYNLKYRTFARFDELQRFTDKDKEDLIEKGLKVCDLKGEEVRSICMGARKRVFEGYSTYVINSFTLVSEVGEELCKRPDCDIGISFYYSFDEEGWRVRMRARNPNINLATIA
jgi:hypothetical protein